MGRVTSNFLKSLDNLNPEVLLIATTNLYKSLDKALTRRFDAIVDFDRYLKEDLVDVGEILLDDYLKQFRTSVRDMRLARKIMLSSKILPYPGDLKNIIRTSLAFSDPKDGTDYLKRLLRSLNAGKTFSIEELAEKKFTVREIEILTGVSKSSVSRELNGAKDSEG